MGLSLSQSAGRISIRSLFFLSARVGGSRKKHPGFPLSFTSLGKSARPARACQAAAGCGGWRLRCYAAVEVVWCVVCYLGVVSLPVLPSMASTVPFLVVVLLQRNVLCCIIHLHGVCCWPFSLLKGEVSSYCPCLLSTTAG